MSDKFFLDTFLKSSSNLTFVDKLKNIHKDQKYIIKTFIIIN